MVGTGLESEKDTKNFETWSLPLKIVLLVVLGDNDLSLCAYSSKIVDPWRKAGDEVIDCLMDKESYRMIGSKHSSLRVVIFFWRMAPNCNPQELLY